MAAASDEEQLVGEPPAEEAARPGASRPSLRLVLKATLGAKLAVTCLALMAMAFFSRQRTTPLAGLQNSSGVVSLEASSGKPDVCDPVIVAETCATLNRQTATYHGTAADEDKSIIEAAELAERLMASPASVRRLLTSLQLTNRESDPKANAEGAYGVYCMELCKGIVHSVSELMVPPTADIGCHETEHGDTCDVDLSSQAVAEIQFPRHQIADTLKEKGRGGRSSVDTLSKEAYYEDRSDPELKVAIMRLFRVHLFTRIVMELSDKQKKEGPKLQKTALRAQAVISAALNAMADKSVPHLVRRWFGNNEDQTRRRIRYVLNNEMTKVLDNVVYRYPGKHCGGETLAYVDRHRPPCQDPLECARDTQNFGKPYPYMVELCDMFFESSEAEQIKTLIHEAAYHHPMDVEDNADGIDDSKQLAKDSPAKALNNADNFCYFVAEVNVAAAKSAA